jgi:hypothetical protein
LWHSQLTFDHSQPVFDKFLKSTKVDNCYPFLTNNWPVFINFWSLWPKLTIIHYFWHILDSFSTNFLQILDQLIITNFWPISTKFDNFNNFSIILNHFLANCRTVSSNTNFEHLWPILKLFWSIFDNFFINLGAFWPKFI